jgi:hypothetical protein
MRSPPKSQLHSKVIHATLPELKSAKTSIHFVCKAREVQEATICRGWAERFGDRSSQSWPVREVAGHCNRPRPSVISGRSAFLSLGACCSAELGAGRDGSSPARDQLRRWTVLFSICNASLNSVIPKPAGLWASTSKIRRALTSDFTGYLLSGIARRISLYQTLGSPTAINKDILVPLHRRKHPTQGKSRRPPDLRGFPNGRDRYAAAGVRTVPDRRSFYASYRCEYNPARAR